MDYDVTAHRVTVRESEDEPVCTPEEAMGWPESVLFGLIAVLAVVCAALPVFA